MITSFEVGSIFKIVDQASPQLRAMLKSALALEKATASIAKNLTAIGSAKLSGVATELRAITAESVTLRKELGSSARAMVRLTGASAGLSAVTSATAALALQWQNVAAHALTATTAMRSAGRLRLPPPNAGGMPPPLPGPGRGGRGGGRHGGMFHFRGPSAEIPGGSHVSMRGNAGLAAAGVLGYGAYEDAEMEDAVFQLIYHAGREQNAENRSMFRGMIQGGMVDSGFDLRSIVEASKQEIRMFQGTPGGGIEILPEMLRAATVEARLKGESPEESMKALIGLAHMTKQYDPAAIKKLAPAFAFLSTANPGSLGSIEKAAGYAVPLLQSGLEIDPLQSLLLGTALTRAGATSTKSGTWLREMALRAMPGTSLMSKTAFSKHEEALKAFGLVDDQDQPTWFTGGKPDIFKMLDIAGGRAPNIPIEKRAAYERALFGAQGGGGFALLADPAVREQVLSLRKEMESPEFKNRYGSFSEAYREGSPMQASRTALANFNVAMMDLGSNILPPVTAAIKDFSSALKYIGSFIPAHDQGDDQTKWKIGTRALEYGGLGALFGSVVPGVGTTAGGVGGALLGAGSAAFDMLPDGVKLGWQHGNRIIPGIGGLIGGGVGGVWQGVGSLFNSAQARSMNPMPPQEVKVEPAPVSIYLGVEKIGEAVIKYIARQGAGAVEGAPYHDATHSFSPLDFALPG